MNSQIRGVAVIFVGALLALLPVTASAQGPPGGVPPGLDRAPKASHDRDDWDDRERRWTKDRKRRASRGRSHRSRTRGPGARGLHIPKGHRPPRGLCRLWYPGRPPGHQPPAMRCRIAVRKQRGTAIVINHRGTVYRRHHPRWHRRPARDIVFRRRPHREEGVSIRVEILIDILGRSGVRRLEAERRRLGFRGTLTAQWISTDRTGERVLRVQAGGHPFAALVDRTGDGYVEDLYVRRDR